MRIINATFTIEEIVKLISCCNQAIINCEEEIRVNGNIQSYNGITLDGSLNKIWSVKNKLKSSILQHMGSENKTNDILVVMDITDMIKLNGCCNGTIFNNVKMIDILGPNSEVSIRLKQENQIIEDIRVKMKEITRNYYPDIVN